MKILHAIHSANAKNGGPIEGIKQLAAENARLGHHVELATLDAPSAPWLKEVPFPVYGLGPGMLSYGFAPRFAPWMRANAPRFDIVIVNGIWQYSSFGTWSAVRGKVPYCVFPHGMLDPWFQRRYPLKHVKKLCYWYAAERRILRDAAAVLFTSEEERLQAQGSFPHFHCRGRVVSYGTRGPEGDLIRQRRQFLEAHPNLEGKRLLLFLGRLHEKKGCDLLLEAAGTLLGKYDPDSPADGKKLHLVMAGPKDHVYARELEIRCAELGIVDHVTWTGMLSGDLKWGAFSAAEAFILPSHQENFGVAVAEALACGVPVLISNKVNIWREIETEGAGLVAEDTLEGTADLLRAWLRLSPAARTEMKSNTRRCFEKHFAIQAAAESLTRTLKSIVESQ